MSLVRLLKACLVVISCLGATAARAEGDVSVHGLALLRDGAAWTPKGMVIAGLVCAAKTVQKCTPVYDFSKAQWGKDELSRVRAYGADVVNLKVAQPPLDPRNVYYDPAYVDMIVARVQELRHANFTVIVSMDWATQTGFSGQSDMPTGDTASNIVSSTSRAWSALAPRFASDRGVMLQVFDEPCAKVDDSRTWEVWRSGHQAAIDAIRASGAHNVLIVEGIRCGKWLTNPPALRDPSNALIYGVHPYSYQTGTDTSLSPTNNFTDADFERNFGAFQRRGHIVLVTEWNVGTPASSCHDGKSGGPTEADIAANLLTYLKARKIGLIIWAADIPSTVWRGRTFDTFTTLGEDDCRVWRPSGAGAMVQRYFKSGEITPP